MELTEFVFLENKVLAISFVLSLIFGAIAQRTSFCTMGAVSDVYNMGSWTRMRVWGMAAGVAMLGFALMSYLGWIRPEDTIYSSGQMNWLSAVAGGLLFGFGMVLASGCVNKTLIRVGEGNLKSIVVFVMIGLGAYSAMWGLASALNMFTVKYGSFYIESGNLTPAWIASAFGLNAPTAGLVMAVLIGGGLTAWALWSPKFRSSSDNLLASIGIGLLVVALWWVIGHMGYVEEHPDTLESVYAGTTSGGVQSFSFTGPTARTIRLLIKTDPNQQIVLNVGGVVAGGCTVGHGLSGVSTLSGVSIIAVIGIMLGAVGGLRLQLWLLMRSE